MEKWKQRRKIHRIWSIVLLLLIMAFVGCQSKEESTEPDTKENRTKETTVPEDTKEGKDISEVLLVTGEYAPYTSANYINGGFLTELVGAVLTNAGIPYRMEFYPWGRCSDMVREGEAWATFPYGYSEDMANDFYSTEAIFESKHKFYYRKNNPKIMGEVMNYARLDEFGNEFVFGGANDYWYGNYDTFSQYAFEVEWANELDALVKMLHAGRIDFFIEDEYVSEEAIHRLFPEEAEEFATLEADARMVSYFLFASKEYPDSVELILRFNQSLEEMRSNGELDEFIKKSGVE